MKSKQVKFFSVSMLTVSVGLSFSQGSFAQLQQLQSSSETTITSEEFNQAVTASTTTTSTLPNMPTIQELAQQTKESNQTGQKIANTLSGIAATGATATCGTSNAAACKWWVAGLVASYVMAESMSQAGDASERAYSAVTASDPDKNIRNPEASNQNQNLSTPAIRAEGDTTVDLRRARNAIDRFKKEGWKIDEKKGDITTPKGEKLNTRSLSSAQSMAAAGAPASFIKDFMNLPKEAAKKVGKKAKAADGAAGMFGGELGGSGGRSQSPSASLTGNLNFPGVPQEPGPKLGIDRDPAQVAGMTKDYHGEKIGVAADSLFHMIDRRYELHQQKGSFLAP